MPTFKVCTADRQIKKIVIASSLDELKLKGCRKLGIIEDHSCRLVDEADGFEIDEDEILMELSGHTFMILLPSERWAPAEVVKYGSHGASTTTSTSDLEKFQPNLFNITSDVSSTTGSPGSESSDSFQNLAAAHRNPHFKPSSSCRDLNSSTQSINTNLLTSQLHSSMQIPFEAETSKSVVTAAPPTENSSICKSSSNKRLWKPKGRLQVYHFLNNVDLSSENNVTTITRKLLSASVTDEEWVELFKNHAFSELVECSINYRESINHLNAFISSHEHLRDLIPRCVLDKLDSYGDDETTLPETFHTVGEIKATLTDILRSRKIPDGFMRVLTRSSAENKSLEQSMMSTGALWYWSPTDKAFHQQWDIHTIELSVGCIIQGENTRKVMQKPKLFHKTSRFAPPKTQYGHKETNGVQRRQASQSKSNRESSFISGQLPREFETELREALNKQMNSTQEDSLSASVRPTSMLVNEVESTDSETNESSGGTDLSSSRSRKQTNNLNKARSHTSHSSENESESETSISLDCERQSSMATTESLTDQTNLTHMHSNFAKTKIANNITETIQHDTTSEPHELQSQKQHSELSMISIFGEKKTKVTQSQYYKVESILQSPLLDETDLRGYFPKLFPYILQRVKMRGCNVLQPIRFAALLKTSGKTAVWATARNPFGSKTTLQTLTKGTCSSDRCPFSRLDCITCLLGSLDDIVTADVYSILLQFPMAIPFIMHNVNDNSHTLMASYMRGCIIKWETISGKIIEHSLFRDPFRMLVSVRLGSNPIGKSTILNQLFARENTFSSASEPGSHHGKPLSLEGSVEMICVTRETCKDASWMSAMKEFYESEENGALLLANLHGDATEFPATLDLLSQFSSRYLVFVMNDCTEGKWNKFINYVGSADKVSMVRVDPDDYNPQEITDIQTVQLVSDRTLHKVREVVKQAFSFPCSSVELNTIQIDERHMNKIVIPAHIETKQSRALVYFVTRNKCITVKNMMRLQIYPYDQKFDEKAAVLRQNQNLQTVLGMATDLLLLSHRDLQRALIDLEKELSRLSNSESQTARNKLSKLRADRRRAMINPTGDTGDRLRKEIDSCLKQIDCMNLGVEHIFREICSAYEVAQRFRNGDLASLLKLPAIAARLLLNGQSMELLDGDMGEIPLLWFTSLCQNVIQQRPGLKVFVISIIGFQSSGKSTLLNSLFACRFAVSVGRCSRGLFMRLLFLDVELAKTHKFDAILLIDTEGLGSPEKMNDPEAEKKDRLLATFAMGISNLTLINVMGENIVDMTEILQIAIVTMTRLEKAEIAPDILMVQYLLTEKNIDKTAQGQDQFTKAIRIAMEFADKKADAVGMRNEKCLRVLFERIEKETQLVQFHPYKDGATVNAPPSELYHEDVLHLYNKILESGRSSKTIIEFKSWYELVTSYWECVNEEDFVLRFKNIKEMHEFIDRGHKISDVKQTIDAAFAFHERQLNAILQPVTERTIDYLPKDERNTYLSAVKQELANVPFSCGIGRRSPCEQCLRAVHEHTSLFEHIKGQSCEEETTRTIESYVAKICGATVNKLAKTYDAINVQQGCCIEYDNLINQRLRELLRDSRQGSYNELQCRKITDDIFEELKRRAAGLTRETPVSQEFVNELAKEYQSYKDIAMTFRQKTLQFNDAIQGFDDRNDKLWKKIFHEIKQKVVGDSTPTREVTHFESRIAALPNKILRNRGAECYDHGMIRELKEEVTKAIDEFQKGSEKLAKYLNKMYLHIWAQQLLLDLVIKLQEGWNEKTNAVCILEANQERYKETIRTRLQFGFTFKSEGKITAQRLIEAVKQIATQTANRECVRRVLDLGWTTNSEKVRLEYLKELACEVRDGKKDRALRHFRHPKEEIEKWYMGKVDRYDVAASNQIFTKTYFEEHSSIRKQIMGAGDIRELFKIVERKLNQAELVEYKPSVMVEDTKEDNFEVLRAMLLETLNDFERPPVPKRKLFNLPSKDREVLARLGCTQRCFWCGALCWGQRGHDDSTDDTRRHHSSHQPGGLIGVKNRHTRMLRADSCHEVDDRSTVCWGNYYESGLPWSEAKTKHFSDWLFDKHYNVKFDELMRWFFQQLHTDIAMMDNSETRKVLPATQEDLERYKCVGLTIDPIISRINALLM